MYSNGGGPLHVFRSALLCDAPRRKILKFSPTAPICHWNAVIPWSPPIVRLQYAALLSLFVSLPSVALTFQPRLEHAEWQAEGDQFECRLIQPIKSFGGVGQFVRRAGELPTFQLISRERWLGKDRKST